MEGPGSHHEKFVHAISELGKHVKERGRISQPLPEGLLSQGFDGNVMKQSDSTIILTLKRTGQTSEFEIRCSGMNKTAALLSLKGAGDKTLEDPIIEEHHRQEAERILKDGLLENILGIDTDLPPDINDFQ